MSIFSPARYPNSSSHRTYLNDVLFPTDCDYLDAASPLYSGLEACSNLHHFRLQGLTRRRLPDLNAEAAGEIAGCRYYSNLLDHVSRSLRHLSLAIVTEDASHHLIRDIVMKARTRFPRLSSVGVMLADGQRSTVQLLLADMQDVVGLVRFEELPVCMDC